MKKIYNTQNKTEEEIQEELKYFKKLQSKYKSIVTSELCKELHKTEEETQKEIRSFEELEPKYESLQSTYESLQSILKFELTSKLKSILYKAKEEIKEELKYFKKLEYICDRFDKIDESSTLGKLISEEKPNIEKLLGELMFNDIKNNIYKNNKKELRNFLKKEIYNYADLSDRTSDFISVGSLLFKEIYDKKFKISKDDGIRQITNGNFGIKNMLDFFYEQPMKYLGELVLRYLRKIK